MNIKEYIESGILDAYVLGALTQEERAEVQANMAQYPDVAAEVAAIEDSMQSFAEENAVPPPAFMKEKIWEAIQEKGEDLPQKAEEDTRETKAIPLLAEERRRQNNWSRAAIWAALIGSLLTNLILWSQSNTNQQKVTAYTSIVDSLKANEQKLATLVEGFKKEKDMLADPTMQTIVMRSMKADKSMAGTIYWSKEKGDAYLALHNMPVPEKGKQYQLWVIADGKPVDMGVISNDMVVDGTMQKVAQLVKDGQAFAISLEKEGGSPVPTMEEIYVLGTVAS
ncbi:MAG: anti-sigma factor [Flavipsychrobacter sp.]